jgi:small subunit ribosomal protein S6
MIKKYEAMIIFNATLGEEGVKELYGKVKELISQFEGTIVDTESKSMGKRKFAYDIDKQSEGYYELVTFNMDSLKVPDFRTQLNYLDNIVRYLIIIAEE